MQIVIDIPEEYYDYIKEHQYMDRYYTIPEASKIFCAIKNGIPLPKGHGRLIILSEDAVKREQISLGFSCQIWISDVGLSNATVAIIEADKAEKEVQDADSD